MSDADLALASVHTQVLQRPEPWQPEPPDQLRRLRRDLLPYLTSPLTIRQVADRGRPELTHADLGRLGAVQRQIAARSAQVAPMLAAEAEMLRGAPLYQVDRDVTLMGVDFGQVPSSQPVQAQYLPSETGLMLFEEPIGGFRKTLAQAMGYNSTGFLAPPWLDPDTEFDVPVVAAAWYRQVTAAGDWLDVSFYTPRLSNRWSWLPPRTVVANDVLRGREATAREMAGFQDQEVRAFAVPELVWHCRHRVRLGEVLTVPKHRATPQAWMQVLYAVWQLHALTDTSTVSETDKLHVPRAERKRDERAEVTDTDGVRVVRLHSRYQATSRDQGAEGPTRNPLDHRVPVGLYRQFKCLDTHRHDDDWENRTDACRHEDRLVGFHLRGPEDAPIRYRVNWLTFRVRPRRPPRPGRRTPAGEHAPQAADPPAPDTRNPVHPNGPTDHRPPSAHRARPGVADLPPRAA